MNPSGDIDQKQDVIISRLINSICYFIETCFIIDLSGTAQGKDRYRLLAFNKDRKKIFIDKYFKTLRGARIAFVKNFNNRTSIDNMSSHWSDFYQPDRDWIEGMLSFVDRETIN